MRLSVSPGIAAAVVTRLLRIWQATLRVKRVNTAVFLDPHLRAQRPVIVLWHDEIFPLIAAHEGEGMVCVVSQSRDGELLAQVLHRFGFLTARGSSSRGGMRALVSAKKVMDERGVGAIFTADGPRGPRHQLKPGAVFLAARCGSPLVPVRVIMDRVKVFHKAWDKFQLPLPFSRCTIIYGDPIRLAGPVDDAGALERQCREIEHIMNTLGSR